MAWTFRNLSSVFLPVSIITMIVFLSVVVFFKREVVEPVAPVEVIKTTNGTAYRAEGMDWFINQTDSTKSCMFFKVHVDVFRVKTEYFMDRCN